jgi:hypothetical protein
MSEFEWTKDHDFAFPDVKPYVKVVGQRLVVQVRTPAKKVGSIILANDTRESEKWNTAVAKVIAVGPLAFRHRNTAELQLWPEGAWCKEGDFVLIPKYGAHTWQQPIPGREAGDEALFSIINDRDVIGVWDADPLAYKGWVIGGQS